MKTMPRNIFEGLRLGSYRGKNSRWKPHGSSVFLLQCSGYLVDYDDMRGWKEKESGFKNNNKSNNKTQASYPLTGQTRSVSLGLWLCHIKSYFGTLQMYCDYLMDSGLWQSLIGTLTFPSFKEVTQNIQGKSKEPAMSLSIIKTFLKNLIDPIKETVFLQKAVSSSTGL